ncbi:MAG: ABC transporter ATP-binding protein [Oscillochloris sp.]|nr:ABC transporter ATP-binding protein [Oscillochloris sp.]
MIEIEDLSKSYGSLQVLRGLSLRVVSGEVYGLLGPNGAGKSTLLHLMLGFLKPSSGHVSVLGSSQIDLIRSQIGYIPERQRYHTRYTAREYLRFIGEFSGLHGAELRSRVDEELRIVGLEHDGNRMLGTFSKGMLQRLGVAQSLLCDPALLLIDEPTSGLDPGGQREVIDLLADVRERGHTIFLCTHYLHEIEHLCDRVGVLSEGRIVVEARVSDLRAPGSSVLIEVDLINGEMRAILEALGRGISCDARTVRIKQNTPQLQAQVLQRLIQAGVAIIALEPLESPLEQLYTRAVHSPAQLPVPTLIAPLQLPVSTLGTPAVHPGLPSLGTSGPAAAPTPSARPAGDGDTLLNELLRRGGVDKGAGEGTTNPE